MKSTENNNAIVLCRSFYDDIAANLAAVALRDHDVPCTIDNQVFSSVYPLGMSALGALRLMVFKKRLGKSTRNNRLAAYRLLLKAVGEVNVKTGC